MGPDRSQEKNTLVKYETFVFMVHLFRAVKGRKGGRILIVYCNGKKDLRLVELGQCVCV